jgi:hypothetical protein
MAMRDVELETAPAVGQDELMEKLGIRHVLVDVFHYREYRYGKLDDAVAQAMRDAAGDGAVPPHHLQKGA